MDDEDFISYNDDEIVDDEAVGDCGDCGSCGSCSVIVTCVDCDEEGHRTCAGNGDEPADDEPADDEPANYDDD